MAGQPTFAVHISLTLRPKSVYSNLAEELLNSLSIPYRHLLDGARSAQACGTAQSSPQCVHGLGQGMVWAVPLRLSAGPQAVRTAAQTGQHLSHNRDKETLASINMLHKIKGLSRCAGEGFGIISGPNL